VKKKQSGISFKEGLQEKLWHCSL